jgi:hypothetical protein
MINDEYEAEKAEAIKAGNRERISIPIIEKRWLSRGLKPGQLVNFRANLPSKKTPIPDNWP